MTEKITPHILSDATEWLTDPLTAYEELTQINQSEQLAIKDLELEHNKNAY